MKHILSIAAGIVICLIYGCSKQAAPEAIGNIVFLTVNATSPTDTLELVKDGKVIFQTHVPGVANTKISVKEGGEEIQVRKKGETEILTTRMVSGKFYRDTLDVIFDNGKVYEKFINMNVFAYSESDVFEVYIDGKLIPSSGSDMNGNPVIPALIKVPVEPGKIRLIDARKRGESEVLASQEIVSDINEQNFRFYYDGQKMINSIDVGPISNPANMKLMAKFSSIVDVYTGPSDLVVYVVNNWVKTFTGLRIELPADGAFGAPIELPAIPGVGAGNNYELKIVQRGSVDVYPYDITNVFLPLKPLSTIYLSYEAGSSAIFSIKDDKQVRERPASLKGTTFLIRTTNVTENINTINFK